MDWLRRFIRIESRHRNDVAYAKAVALTDDILFRMRKPNRDTEAARSVVADVWSQARNTPFMTTIYQTTQEMTAPLKQQVNPPPIPKTNGRLPK